MNHKFQDLHALKRFAVGGNPILHSLSPFMFNYLFKINQVDAHYSRILAKDADELLETAKKLQLTGFNVTSPFKEEIVPLLDVIDDDVKLLGASNLVIAKENRIDGKLSLRWHGYNTDGYGVLKAIEAHSIDIQNLEVLILGLGGAAKAAALALYKKGAKLHLYNRTDTKAHKFAKMLEGTLPSGDTTVLNSVKVIDRHDYLPEFLKKKLLIVSALPQGIYPFPLELIQAHHTVFDANYHKSQFIKQAKQVGALTIDPLEWLIHQADLSYQLLLNISHSAEILLREGLQNKQNWNNLPYALIGFMGSGKSSVSEILANSLGLQNADMDADIVNQTGKSISQFFSEEGEISFRKIEAQILEKNKHIKNAIITTGGGVVETIQNQKLLEEHMVCLFLYGSLETLLKRIKKSDSESIRPLFNKNLNNRFWHRFNLYFRASDLILNTDNHTLKQIVSMIADEYQKNN